MPKVLKPICSKLWCLSACKISTSSLTSFLRLQTCYYGNFSNTWPFHQNHNINLKETFMLICMQKINLITHFFLKILQRNRKRVSLDNLGMPGHIHLNWYQFKEAYGIHLKAKKQFHLSCFLWDIADIANLLSWVLWACLTMHTQNYTINLQKTFVYLQTKNQLHPTCFSGNIPKICKLLVLGTLGMPDYTHPKW